MKIKIEEMSRYCGEMERAVMTAAGVCATTAGTPWHLDPDTERGFVELVQPAQISHFGPKSAADMVDMERPAWRLTPVTIELPVAEGESPVPQFTGIIADLARHAVKTRDVGREYNPDFKDGGVLMVMWRRRPVLEFHFDGVMHARARLIFSFMPRSFLGNEPNNGLPSRPQQDARNIYMSARCQGKSELGKLFREARESVREMTGIKSRVIMESNPSGPNWWGEYYKKAFAEHIAIDEAAEFDWDAVAKARTEAMIRGGREILEKRAAEIFAGIHTMPDGTKITREEMQDHGKVYVTQGQYEVAKPDPTPYIATHGTEYLGVDLARPDANDVNVFQRRSLADLKESDFSAGDVPYSMRVKPPVERKPINVFDAVKAAARWDRIKRNEMQPVPMDLTLPDVTKMIETTRREHNLCKAIDRVELPHETTIHDRLMPYRHRED